jgi:uncharacterized small protein (DUF1192 family)
MIDDETRPVVPVAHQIGADLSTLSFGELQERITLLKTEIERLEAELAAKDSTRHAAESLFSRG